MTKTELLSELLRVDAQINDARASKGKLTILKSYQRKLYAQYMRAA
jgi:hypothetical protein